MIQLSTPDYILVHLLNVKGTAEAGSRGNLLLWQFKK